MRRCDAHVLVRTPTALMEKAAVQAKAEGISRSELIRRALRARLETTE